jgi:oligopeptide/dipeptide ABC transporter ATP-binding protein
MAGAIPHEFSGGQRQRIAIARALAVAAAPADLRRADLGARCFGAGADPQPAADLQRELAVAYLFITHNIAVVDYLAHDVAVMYLGRIVERGSAEEVLRAPRIPTPGAAGRRAAPRCGVARRGAETGGDMPSPANPPAGCHFHPRCPRAGAGMPARYPDETPRRRDAGGALLQGTDKPQRTFGLGAACGSFFRRLGLPARLLALFPALDRSGGALPASCGRRAASRLSSADCALPGTSSANARRRCASGADAVELPEAGWRQAVRLATASSFRPSSWL